MVRAKKVNLLEPVDIAKVNIRRDDYFSNAYIIDLPLDAEPDHVWQDIFEREWMMSRSLWDRKTFIIGDMLRLITPPHDMEEKINWVREVIAATNKSVENYYKQVALMPNVRREAQRALVQHTQTIARIRRALRTVFQR